jgi:hypothetical protein
MADLIRIPPEDDNVLVTVKELAYLLRRHHGTVYRWRGEGMPFTAGQIRICEARAWLLQQDIKKREKSRNFA